MVIIILKKNDITISSKFLFIRFQILTETNEYHFSNYIYTTKTLEQNNTIKINITNTGKNNIIKKIISTNYYTIQSHNNNAIIEHSSQYFH